MYFCNCDRATYICTRYFTWRVVQLWGFDFRNAELSTHWCHHSIKTSIVGPVNEVVPFSNDNLKVLKNALISTKNVVVWRHTNISARSIRDWVKSWSSTMSDKEKLTLRSAYVPVVFDFSEIENRSFCTLCCQFFNDKTQRPCLEQVYDWRLRAENR